MNAGLPDPVSVGVVFAPLAFAASTAGFLWKRAIRRLVFIGVGLSESVMGYFLTVMQFLAGRE